ncbi:phosphopantetheine-binding protein [Nonomuraea polychroma]|uniref:phosphopantetheine-binding protein n=1 Tax=Nonomuraea polychroma TaxID=46176 RepID=UPI003D8EC4DA
MPKQTFTLDDLKTILLEATGEGADLSDDVRDVEFNRLGFDSIAMLEVATRIARDHDVPFDAAAEAATPRRLLALVNGEVIAEEQADR